MIVSLLKKFDTSDNVSMTNFNLSLRFLILIMSKVIQVLRSPKEKHYFFARKTNAHDCIYLTQVERRKTAIIFKELGKLEIDCLPKT